ncbi:hypothetical protein ScPMuIL_015952 [Solemya velum]
MRTTSLLFTLYVNAALCFPQKESCPSGWVVDSNNRKCYFYHETPRNFSAAVSVSTDRNLSSQIAQMSSEKDAILLKDILRLETMTVWSPYYFKHSQGMVHAVDQFSKNVSDCDICERVIGNFSGGDGVTQCLEISGTSNTVNFTLVNCDKTLPFVMEIILTGTDDRQFPQDVPWKMDKKDIAAIVVGIFILVSFMVIVIVDISRNNERQTKRTS